MSQFTELYNVIARMDNPEDIEKFFAEMLTENERKDLMLRWQLMKMLKEGLPQRKIASELGISLCKITRGSKILKEGDSLTSRIIDKLKVNKGTA